MPERLKAQGFSTRRLPGLHDPHDLTTRITHPRQPPPRPVMRNRISQYEEARRHGSRS